MTRFLNAKTGNFGINDTDAELLFEFLRTKFDARIHDQILQKIETMGKTNKDYGVLEISDNIISSVFKSQKDGGVKFHVGYPFPIATEDYKTFPGYDVNVYVRNEPVRKIQRKYAFNSLKADYEAKSHKHNNTAEFKHQLSGISQKYANECLYVDSYDFIGDSIIGIYFLDEIMTNFELCDSKGKIFSKHWKHMPTKYQTAPLQNLSDYVKQNDNFTIIIPNLIDNQFDAFLKIMADVKGKNVLAVVPSRNMFIELNHGKATSHWYKAKDVLFTTQTIDNYMDTAMEPFRIKNKTSDKKSDVFCRPLTKNVFINPFSSLEGKQIKAEDCKALCNKLLNSGFKVFVSAGVKQDEYLDQLKGLNVQLVTDSGLKDLSEQLSNNDIGLVVSTDSGVSHMTASVGIATIILYNSFFWDEYSKQSVSNDGIGGFCRAHAPMIPVVDHGIFDAIDMLFGQQADSKVLDIVHNGISGLKGATNKEVLKIHKNMCKEIGNLPDYYNPDLIIGKALDSSTKTNSWSLVRNIWQNMPAYKISRIQR
jgi:hypothetical protein